MRVRSLILALLSAILLLTAVLPVTSMPDGETVKVYIYSSADVSILAHPDFADENFANMEELIAGYLYIYEDPCEEGQPCLLILTSEDFFTLLKFQVPEPQGEEIKKILLYLPAKSMEWYLPEDDFKRLCKFSLARFTTDFSESEVTWNELKPGVSWDPWDYVDKLGSFYINPDNTTPFILDLTDELKDQLMSKGELRLAIVPDPEWWEYGGWEEWMGCYFYMASSEGGKAPMLLIEYGPKEVEPEPIPPVAYLPPESLVPTDLGALIDSLMGEGGEEEQDYVPFPDICLLYTSPSPRDRG